MTSDFQTSAATGGTNVVAFPRRRSTEPLAGFGSIMHRDGYDHCFLAVHIAKRFAETDGLSTLETVRELMQTNEVDGPLAVGNVLAHTMLAIAFLRSSLAYLEAADARIAAAADTVVTEAGR